jgi:hypothetical protein
MKKINNWENLHVTFDTKDWQVYDRFMRTLSMLDLQEDVSYVERAGGQGVCS